MDKRLKQKLKNQLKLRTRLVLVVGASCLIIALTIGWLVFLNITQNTTIKASMNDNGGTILNNHEIITEFTWDHDPATRATLGPDAIKISGTAHVTSGGRASTNGLAPGNPAKNIDMEIASSPLFDVEGIDVSIDFKRHEPSGSFFTRGKSFDFGFKKGFITITYRVFSAKGGSETINETTDYEIPQDEMFRNYRFIYTPTTGKAEIFVNSVIVWSHEGEGNTAMYWKDADNIVIGKEIDGGGIDQPILDNLVIRSTGSVSPLGESLINFMLETTSGTAVKIYWSTKANDKVDHFTIERSVNGVDFANLADIKSKPESEEEVEYTYDDNTISSQKILFYRIRETFKDGRFITHSASAVKMKTEHRLTIDKVSPDPFENTFNLSYYLPAPGRVWIQLLDEDKKIKCSETFEAQPGKNIYIFRDKNNLTPGTYILNVVYDDKKVSAKVVKV